MVLQYTSGRLKGQLIFTGESWSTPLVSNYATMQILILFCEQLFLSISRVTIARTFFICSNQTCARPLPHLENIRDLELTPFCKTYLKANDAPSICLSVDIKWTEHEYHI